MTYRNARTDNRRVIGKSAISVELLEIRKQPLNIVVRVRALRMSRQLRDLPGTELGEYRLRELVAFVLKIFDFLADIEIGVRAHAAQLLDLLFEFCDGLFEIEKIEVHWQVYPGREHLAAVQMLSRMASRGPEADVAGMSQQCATRANTPRRRCPAP